MTRAARSLVLASAAACAAWGLGVRPLLRGGDDPFDPTWPVFILLVATVVHVPLGLALAEPSSSSRPLRLARRAQLPAALALFAAFAFDRGPLAGALALPWAGVTALIALAGAERLVRRKSLRPAPELCIDLGLLYVAVGGAWAVLSRALHAPLGFPDIIGLLTAVHFHFAGFSLCILAGVVGRARGGISWLVVASVLLGIAALAVAITLAQAGSDPGHVLERASGVVFFVGGCIVAAHEIVLARSRPPLARALLTLSGLALVPSLGLGALYAAHLWGVPALAFLDVRFMYLVHGSANALGFALLGLVGWTLAPPIVHDERRSSATR